MLPLPLDEHRLLLDEQRFALAYDGGDLERWQRQASAALAELVHFEPTPSVHRARSLWQYENELGRVEKLVLSSDTSAAIPIYWCLPRERSAALPAMICLQGHTTGMHQSLAVSQADERTHEPVAGDRDFARQCLQRGIAAVCVEQRGFGERREVTQQKKQTDCVHMAMRALLLGRTLVGERVHDVNVALRWLLDQPQIDPKRIGAMGNSAGGTTAMYAASLIEAIQLAVVSCSFGRLRDTWFEGRRCVCGYVPGMMRVLDLPDVLTLRIPRPVVVVGGAQDYHSPEVTLRPAFADVEQRYRAAGVEDRCRLIVGPEGHRFYADAAWPTIEHLL